MRRVAVLIAALAAALLRPAFPGGAVTAAAPASAPSTIPAATPAAAPPAPATPTVRYGSITLAQARQAMAKAPAGARYADWLVAHAEALGAADAATLIAELASKAGETDRPALLARAGSIYLAIGRYREAAAAFERSGLPEWRMTAARCRIAAGEFKAARSLAAAISATSAADAALVRSWAALLEGAVDVAWKEAASALGSGAAVRREALFLQWLAASAPDSVLAMVLTDIGAPGDPRVPRAALLAEYSGSAEAALVSGKIRPESVAWLVLGIYPRPEESAPKQAGTAKSPDAQGPGGPMVGQAAASAAGTGTNGSTNLQAGWFSRRENADNLAAVLKKKGFAARVETQKTKTGETRWAVLVEPDGDWTKTQARLKDAGYESYPTD